MIEENKNLKPFVKWVGGKTQLLNEIREKYPLNIEKYCEPFVGGGAVFFDVLNKFFPKEVLINDINKELINTYIQIKENINDLIIKLKKYEKNYIEANEENRKFLYYENRNKFNDLIKGCKKEEQKIEKAALLIFLNKTCFNGLYRVNAEGFYNVPEGKYKNPLICDEENLININKKIKNVQIKSSDFENCEDFIDKKTFVYIDPPYRPLTKTAAFTSYSKNDFTDSEQIRLGEFINRINKKNAKIVLSNSDPKNIDIKDNFFDELYKDYKIIRISAKRMINSDATKRGFIKELLIANY